MCHIVQQKLISLSLVNLLCFVKSRETTKNFVYGVSGINFVRLQNNIHNCANNSFLFFYYVKVLLTLWNHTVFRPGPGLWEHFCTLLLSRRRWFSAEGSFPLEWSCRNSTSSITKRLSMPVYYYWWWTHLCTLRPLLWGWRKTWCVWGAHNVSPCIILANMIFQAPILKNLWWKQK